MNGVVFLFSQFSPIEIIIFNKHFYTPLKILTSWFQMKKDISPVFVFCKVLGV